MNELVLRGKTALAMPLNSGSLDTYINAVGTIPVLDADAEHKLALRLRDKDDLKAAQELVMSNLRFVVHIARGYMGYGLQLADLIQEGNVGLMKAVKRYDPDRGVRLVAFAVHWIKAEIHEYVIRNWRIVKVATTKAQRKLFFNLRKAKDRLGWFSHDEAKAVADDLGVSTNDVYEMESRLSGRDVGLLGDNDDDDDTWKSPIAHLASNDADPAELVDSRERLVLSHQGLQTGLTKLDDRSRDIIESRWLTEPKKTLHDLADKYSVSAERIRQLEANALKKLQGSFSAIAA